MLYYLQGLKHLLEMTPVMGDFRLATKLIQPRLNSISANGAPLRVEPKVMQVLVCLAEHAGDVVEKERLIRTVWAGSFVTDDVLTRAISELRHVFEDDPKSPRVIETIPKVGYRLIAPVEPHHPLTPSPEKRVVEAVSSARSGGAQGMPETSETGADVVPVPQAPERQHRPHRHLWLGGGLAAVTILAILSALIALNIAGLRSRLFPRSIPRSGQIRLVVLPFENLSGDPEQEYLSDGMTEEMTAQLARLQPERLAVIGRSSAMTYKGGTKTIDQIGKELNVQYVLEGSVRRAGDRVRVTAQLIKVGEQTHVWAEQYDRDLRDVLGLQADVARSVAEEILLPLTLVPPERAASIRPTTPEAYEAYLRGRYLWNRRTPDDFRKSIAYFQQAIRLDPGYALAYAGLADSLSLTHGGAEEARVAATKALELDPEMAAPHATLASIKMDREWDWGGAEKEFKRAIELDPTYPTAHHWYSIFLINMGRPEEALKEARRAVELDPLSPIIQTNLAHLLAEMGRTEEGFEEVRKVLELDPGFAPAHMILGLIQIRRHAFREAIPELRKAGELDKQVDETLDWIGYAYGMSGQRAKAEEAVKELQTMAVRDHEPPPARSIACVYLGLGNKEKALEWLAKAYDQRDRELASLKEDAFLDPLRSDPRFQALLRRMNFPP